ncbi:class I SAM-dependent methyltransferase [soil metagenome]
MNCRLCKSTAISFYTGRFGEYFDCPRCRGVFLAPEDHLNAADERARYEIHNNNVDDAGYQNFVKPIVDTVLSSFTTGKKGLDFGCGTGPVISYLLSKEGYSVDLYDPIFSNETLVFRNRYDFIVCCEVIEHFRHPGREFLKLQQLLEPGGKLVCMTQLLADSIDFDNWTYKDDPTHIFFYRSETISYIQRHFGFESSTIEDRLIVFSNF